MEEEKRKGKQLDFNAPLLSIKRHGSSIDAEISCTNSRGIRKFQDTSDRIPFSWEKAAGKPKDSGKGDSVIQDDDITPRLRIPPGRLWNHRHRIREFTSSYDDSQFFQAQDLHQNHSCDADVDDDFGDNNNDVFSDAAEVLSLTEAIDIVEKAEKGHGLDGFNMESHGHNESISPSYIIDRFLPDAAALAASTVLSVSKSLKKLPCNHPQACVPQAARRSYTMPKGCGLEMLFPWRMKHRICGVKRPIRQPNSAKGQHDHGHSSRNRSNFH